MYLPRFNYSFSKPEKVIKKTQQNAFSSPMAALMKPLCLAVTFFAIICDFYQVKYFLDLYTKEDSRPLIPVAILIVLSLDCSMYLLGDAVNALRTSKAKKKDVATKAFFLVLSFVLAYFIYLVLAYVVIKDIASSGSGGGKVQYFRLFLPAMTSVFCFATSLNFSNTSMIAKLKLEALSVQTDLSSARALAEQIARDMTNFSATEYEKLKFASALKDLSARTAAAEHEARCALNSYLQCNQGVTQDIKALGLGKDFLQSTLVEATQAESFFTMSSPITPDPDNDMLDSL